MDRLGDLNLINASPVCSQGHVPFCQDIRFRVSPSYPWFPPLLDPWLVWETREKVAPARRANTRYYEMRRKKKRKGGLRQRDKDGGIFRPFPWRSCFLISTKYLLRKWYYREYQSWNFSQGMHSGKKSCANLPLDDTIKHLQSENKRKR